MYQHLKKTLPRKVDTWNCHFLKELPKWIAKCLSDQKEIAFKSTQYRIFSNTDQVLRREVNKWKSPCSQGLVRDFCSNDARCFPYRYRPRNSELTDHILFHKNSQNRWNRPGGRGTGKIAVKREKRRERTVSLVIYCSFYLDIRRICGCFVLQLESCRLVLVSKGRGTLISYQWTTFSMWWRQYRSYSVSPSN